MSDIEYVSIDRDELKRLQADSEELANLLAAQQQADPVMQVSSEVSKQISKRGRDAIMAAERLVTLDESKTVSLEDMESRFGVEPATHSEDGQMIDTSAWQACNPGCDPEFNGEKGRHCVCDSAKAAMSEKKANSINPEIVDVVGYTTAGMLSLSKDLPITGRIGAKCKPDKRWNVPLMTVAQHERIVTGLQAELETERQHAHDQHSAWTVCDAERQQLRAQPARQVGGGERLEEAERLVREAWRLMPDDGRVAVSVWHLCASEFINAKTESGAALAPVVSQVGDEPIRDDDLVLVPRGLLGAARYAIKNKVDAPNVHGQLGEYCYGQAALAPAAVDQWAPSEHEYDRAIHHNPDAKAWADLFVATFPGLIDKHDLMIGWFANAMMAMHDWLKSKGDAPAAVVPEKIPSQPFTTIDKGCKNYKAGWNAAINEFARLNSRDELKRLQADAARYHFVRDVSDFDTWETLASLLPDEWDDYVDDAMLAAQGDSHE